MLKIATYLVLSTLLFYSYSNIHTALEVKIAPLVSHYENTVRDKWLVITLTLRFVNTNKN